MKMQDKTGNNGQTDRLGAYMKQRLDRHRLPVEEACWEEIERRLQASAALSRAPRRRWYAFAAAAAALFVGLAGLFFLPGVRSPEPTAGIVEKEIEERAGGEKNAGLPPDILAGRQDGILSAAPTGRQTGERNGRQGGERNGKLTGEAKRRSASRPGKIASGKEERKPDKEKEKGSVREAAEEAGSGPPVADTAAGQAVASASVPVSAGAEKKKRTVSGPEEAPGAYPVGVRLEKTSSMPSRRGWLLAVAGAAGGGIAGGSSSFSGSGGIQNGAVNDPLPDPDYKPLPPPVVPDESFAAEDYAEADYALPLSFGLMARKNLNDRLALESGLVYTYLSSRFASPGSLSRKARLELHYLGIPLNLVVYAWNHPRWKVYFTAGGMVEKGLKSLYSQQVYREGELAVLSRKEDIGGVQWSLHFSAGADYRFYKAWSFYLEPRLSRYYDNGQPASYRTAHAWSLGLGGGIRYAF